MNADEQVQHALAEIKATESLVGLFVSQTGNIATVDQAASRLVVKSVTQVPVRPGDAVRLEWRSGELVMLGPTVPRATVGRITAPGNPATVEYPAGSGVTAALPVMNGISLVVNDLVFLDWGSAGLIVGKISTPVEPPAPGPPPPTGGGRRTERFEAIDSGSYQNYWRTNDVWSSASNFGAWFYGSKIRDTIPDNATIISASINLPLDKELGVAPFGRHPFDEKPSGPLTITATSTLDKPWNGETKIPLSLVDHLKANPGGLGFGIGGYNIWRGTQRDGSSGALTVTYET